MDVLMPQLGETVLEGKITVWFKSVGDKVAPGDNLFEIETDKGHDAFLLDEPVLRAALSGFLESAALVWDRR